MIGFKKYGFLVSFVVNIALCGAQKAEIKVTSVDKSNLDIAITIPVEQDQYLYADLIQLSVNNPHVHLSAWQSSVEPIIQYDSIFKENRKIITKSPVLTFKVTKDEQAQGTMDLRLIYYTNKSKTAVEQVWPLSFGSQAPEVNQAAACPITEHLKAEEEQKDITATVQPQKKSISWFEYLKSRALESNLLWVRLLIAFFLGLLLSLTPCIYPMIPITVGILNAHGSHSFLRNFSLALSYTMGIATTFALLGLAAALAGHAFGSLMHHPIVIIFIVLLLIYSAFSLFGFYEIRMPKFLQKSNAQGGNMLAAYLFGAASGTIASPCLSPGLLFMLTLVATLKSFVAGFLLLFCFAIGISMPLLVVGTFSSSIKMLPRAGAWMLEIKYLFGFMLLGMCFYFLTSILPIALLGILMSAFLIISGIFYLYHARSTTGSWKHINNIIGTILIACSIYSAAQAIKNYYLAPIKEKTCLTWMTDFVEAKKISIQSKKPIFIFIHAPRCLACTELFEKFSADTKFMSALCNVVPVDCNLANRENPSTKIISGSFEILGAPSCLLLDCATHQVIKRWDGELDSQQYEDLTKTLAMIQEK